MVWLDNSVPGPASAVPAHTELTKLNFEWNKLNQWSFILINVDEGEELE